jgi:SOS response regulatory protein OraA/RecX
MRTPESECLEKAMRLLSRSSHSKRRLSEKLSAAYDSTIVEQTLVELDHLGLLKEREECLIWLNHFLLSKKSKKEVFFALLKRGFEKELITELLETISDERELENALRLLKNTKGLKSNAQKSNEKVFAKLIRKGFSAEVVRIALKTFNNCEFDSDFYENTDSLA